MIIVIDDCIIANCALYGNLSFLLSLCLYVCRSVAPHHSASSTPCWICSLLLHLFIFFSLSSTHTSLFSHLQTHVYTLTRSHTHTHKDSLAGAVSILKGLSVSISQQPCPRGCALPTLLPREELWRSANRFLLSLSCYSAPGFTPACKNQPAAEPIPSVTICFITKTGAKQRRRRKPKARAGIISRSQKEGEACCCLSSSHTSNAFAPILLV